MSNKTTSTIEILFEKAENYTRTSIELAKLNVIDKTSDVMSSLISRLAIAIVFVMFLLLFNFGLSFWIGKMLGDFFYGFIIVSLFYLIVTILLYAYKDQWIKIPVSNFIIRKMLKHK